MTDSDESSIPVSAGFEELKRIISRNLPENMGLLELLLIREWLSQEIQSCTAKSKRLGDLEKLSVELDKQLKGHEDQSSGSNRCKTI